MTDRTFFVYIHRRPDTGEVFYVGKGTRTKLKQYIRANTTSRRNIYWRRVVAKAGGFSVEVLADFFDEVDAFAYECELISAHGRVGVGGALCNLTDGGEGHSGLSPSEETRRKMSNAHRGRPKPDHVKRAVSLAQRGVPNPPEQGRAHSERMSGKNHPKWGKKDSPETIAKRVATRGRQCAGADCHFYGKPQPDHIKAKLREANSKKVIDRATGTLYARIADAAAAVGKSTATVSRWLTGARRNPTSLEFA